MSRRARSLAISFAVGLIALAGCGKSTTGDVVPAPADITDANTPASSLPVVPGSSTDGAPAVTAPSSAASAFVVDGPLVTNGPPWSCLLAGTDCVSPDANLLGTIELVHGCIIVRNSEFDSLTFVIFPYGVSWDDTTQTIVGLEPDPVHVGDEIDWLANSADRLDVWLARYRLPPVPDKVHQCMAVAQTEYVYWNSPWFGVQPVVTPESSAPER